TWFSGFENSGFIVLNYGDICSFMHISTLNNEKSVDEIWQFLHKLEEGELQEASTSLRILFQKWEGIRSQASGENDQSTLQ
ncbi:MAG: hypothetical protein ACERKJ_03815, partial [Candidatus Dadabacteria bacterium]